jgi:GNAT superfamily N-acetyltransferase
MKQQILVRDVTRGDQAAWRPLWDGYNAFYGRSGATALDEAITARTWDWFFDPASGVRCFVAESDGEVVGIVHCLFHRSTTRLRDVCYLQDLFTSQAHRGRGVGRLLIERVAALAREAGSSRLYWTTQATNAAGRALYDKVAEHKGFIVYAREL